MAQVLKPEVEARILRAAEEVFARDGYRGAKVATIAKAAGLSAGNVYRYFSSKAVLFSWVLDPDFVARFDSLLDRRVQALATTDLRALGDGARAAAEEMLSFWIAHRLRVVILLDRCAGSDHEGFGDRFVARLVELTEAQLAAERGAPLDPLVRPTLTRIFESSRRAVVSILESHDDEETIREAFAAFWSFQLAGLEGFRRWVTT